MNASFAIKNMFSFAYVKQRKNDKTFTKNVHPIQSIFNFGCFINFFVSMKINLSQLNATWKVAQQVYFSKILNIFFEKMHSKFQNLSCIEKVYWILSCLNWNVSWKFGLKINSDVKQSKLMSNLDRDIRQNSRCRCLQSMVFSKSITYTFTYSIYVRCLW